MSTQLNQALRIAEPCDTHAPKERDTRAARAASLIGIRECI